VSCFLMKLFCIYLRMLLRIGAGLCSWGQAVLHVCRGCFRLHSAEVGRQVGQLALHGD